MENTWIIIIRGTLTLALLLFVLPLLCGGLLNSDDEDSPLPLRTLERYLRGFIATLALFEITAVPFILCRASFRLMSVVYGILLAALCVWAFLAERKKAKSTEAIAPEKPALRSLLPWLGIGLLLIIQAVFFITHQYLDGDDSYYVAQSVIAMGTDTMFQKDAYNGYSIFLDRRHSLGALPIWVSWLSLCSGIHPAVMAHSILAPFFLSLMYGCYTALGARLLKDKQKWLPLFVLLLGLWYTHSATSLYTAETFAYTRTWQGKAVFGNIMIPLAFCWLWDLFTKKKKAITMLVLLSCSAVLCTTAASYLLLICYGCAALCMAVAVLFRSKKLRNAVSMLLPFVPPAIPLLLFCLLYILLLKADF